MDTAEIHTLIAACIAGDETAIEKLIDRFEADVYRFALAFLREPSEAREAAQDTFVLALRRLSAYEDRASFKAWLYAIALNVCRDRQRRERSQARLLQNLIGLFQVATQKQKSLEELVITTESEALLKDALAHLSEKQRTAIILRYFQGLTISEIAEVLNINEGTVHSRLHTALQQLKAWLIRLESNS